MINIAMIIFYDRKSNLDSHKMVHIDAKHHKYEKSYTSKHLLSRHINAKHTERPYKCEECSATFSYLSSHVGHTKRYSEKPYLCEVCAFKLSLMFFSIISHLIDFFIFMFLYL